MTAHIVLPARRSQAPDQWVSWCVNPACQQPSYGETRGAAYEAGKAHCAAENATAPAEQGVG